KVPFRFSDFGGESREVVPSVRQKLLVTNGLIEGMDILPLEVFDVKHFHMLLVVHLSDLHGNRRQFELRCRVVAAVPCRNLVLSRLRRRPHEQRRQNSIRRDTRHQLCICRWIPPAARVAWRWFNCVERNICKLHSCSLIECSARSDRRAPVRQKKHRRPHVLSKCGLPPFPNERPVPPTPSYCETQMLGFKEGLK